MIPAVFRRSVLEIARITERKINHGRLFPVVGKIRDRCVPRTAIGADSERIEVPPIGWVEEFLQAVIADTGVWRDDR